MKAQTLLCFLIIKFALSFVFVMLLFIAKVPRSSSVKPMSEQYGFWTIILLVTVLIPILEELMFRSFLRFNKYYVLVSSFLLTHLVLSKFYFKEGWLTITPDLPTRLTIPLIVGLLGFALAVKLKQRLNKAWSTYFPYLFYISFLLFGLLHITKFEINAKTIILAPFLTAPQVIGGIIYSYVRVQYGLIYSIKLHAINNVVPAMVMAMTSIY
ncbi:CPBP family glutamic-type intramembrane protease [Spongiivirga sp. MCCC 1A20706]